jgi:hypothetical protein
MTRELEAEITRLLKSGLEDRSLRSEMDALAEKEPSFHMVLGTDSISSQSHAVPTVHPLAI